VFTRSVAIAFSVSALTLSVEAAKPALLDDQFELPSGFHIYRAAARELTGGSYAMTFDGNGRLLIGDGTALRRLSDSDGNGVYDQEEVIATDLGWRGPQGVLVYGDRLYAIGGDGVQLYSGYLSGRIHHIGRIGNKFSTGGDHDAHTLLRGFDGSIYLMAGNGAGIKARDHITETNSPMLFEREASIFRFDPDGTHWECIATGGRNPPNLGQNYMGDFFSFDSDMEWHVGLPWYRPVRLNHWIVGADQGWQEVGAFPPYYIDCISGILDIGRGSPTWGTFYEHTQFPAHFRNNYIACDYRWKAANNDQYSSSGRLVCFALERSGASWKGTMEVLAQPRAGAKDFSGQPINFALVDVKVAPDGSLVVSDHNQGIWRIFYSSEGTPAIPNQSVALQPATSVDELLRFPQPDSEWSRVVEERSVAQIPNASDALQLSALKQDRALSERLRALRLLTPMAGQISFDWLRNVAADPAPEIRAWVPLAISFRSQEHDFELLRQLARDLDPLVRRRVAECFTRRMTPSAVPVLIQLLGDQERVTRYPAMSALAHLPTDLWLELALASTNSQIALRGLVAGASVGTVPPNAVSKVVRHIRGLTLDREDQLDLLRVLALFRTDIITSAELEPVRQYILSELRSNDRDVRWESIRLCGEYEIGPSIAFLAGRLAEEANHETQFHIVQSLARIADGWTVDAELTLLDWLIANQNGWFAEFESKGVEFPLFWGTTLNEFASRHPRAMVQNRLRIRLEGLLGTALISVLAPWRQTISRPAGSLSFFVGFKRQSENCGGYERSERSSGRKFCASGIRCRRRSATQARVGSDRRLAPYTG
jgi:glucose/arabinose dehydrogenase